MSLPARIGKYELLERLGGGAAEVYRARDSALGRMVALKILTEAALADAEAHARFLAEARLIGRLAHENIVGYYDYGEEAGRPFLVMQYCDGESLRDAMHGFRTGGIRNQLLIARQIASALAYVHSKGIIHRDVKPDNVWIESSGGVKIIDFGVAKSEEFSITGAGFTLGTPYYMSPELVRGEQPTPLVDVYSFGVLLYEMVTGTRPFEGQTVSEIFDQIVHQRLDLTQLEKSGVPDAVSDLIRGCTAKEPAARTQDFSTVVGKMDEILRRMPENGPCRRWLLIGAVALLLLAFFTFWVLRSHS
jgi:serine/threonine protein kinase